MAIFSELLVPLSFDGSDFESGLERSMSKASAFGSFFGNIAANVVTGAFNMLGEGVQKLGGFLASTVEEASASQDAIAQLEAVIKSTGGAAGITSQHAQDLASSLQKVTRFSDEAILGGENMLLTFTSIGKDVFPRATQTILDMSQALGTDLKGSAIQLGKALNSPIEGITALRRVGVQFSDEQETMIKQLVESGNLMQAQTLILDELQKEFGGSAEAAGQTFAGQLDILKNKLSDIKENIGNALMPVLTELATRFSTLIDSPKVQALIDAFVTKLGEAGEWIITNLPIWIENFNTFATNLSTWYENDVKPILDKLGEKLAVAIPVATEVTKKGFGVLAEFWKTNVTPVGEQIARLFTNVKDILGLMGLKVDGGRIAWQVLLNVLSPALLVFKGMRDSLTLLRNSLDLINDVLEAAKRKWQSVTSAVWSLVNALANLSIPFWLTPGSPTPLEMGLRGIGNAMNDLNKNSLPQFQTNLGMSGNNGGSPAGAGIDYHMLARVLAKELATQFG